MRGQYMAWGGTVVFSAFCSCRKRIRPAAHESGTEGEITSPRRGQQVKSSTRVTAHPTKPERKGMEGVNSYSLLISLSPFLCLFVLFLFCV